MEAKEKKENRKRFSFCGRELRISREEKRCEDFVWIVIKKSRLEPCATHLKVTGGNHFLRRCKPRNICTALASRKLNLARCLLLASGFCYRMFGRKEKKTKHTRQLVKRGGAKLPGWGRGSLAVHRDIIKGQLS